jgi:hypothetical protein
MPERENDKNLFTKTLDWICQKLEAAGIPYMITGGAVVGFWGHIRTTMDIDIVIQIYGRINSFLQDIEKEAYVDIEEAKKSILNRSMFNIILNNTCFKVDIIPLDDKDDYEIAKFKRRIKIKLHNKDIFITSPEDLIISKLLWSKSAGGSERQLRDSESIYKLNRDTLDLNYIRKWVKILNIEEEFRKVSL